MDSGETTSGTGPETKPWWKRWWGITLIVFGVLVVIGALAGDPETTEVASDDGTATEVEDDPTVVETPTVTEPPETISPAAEETTAEEETTADEETTAEAEPEPEPDSEPAFGGGTHTVGQDIQPGTYRSDGASSMCYWARKSGFSGELDDIIANGNSAPEIVTVAASDAGFESQGCGDWYVVEDTYEDAPLTEFDSGTFAVGGHIEPGTYRASGESGDMCYWARLSNFSHEMDGIITNGNNPTTIDISSSDAGFTTQGCGTWTRA